MNKTTKSLVSLSIPAIAIALSMPVLAAAAAPSGRVAIMNAHSGLCLSPAGGGRDKNSEIVQFTCDQDPSRFWSFTDVDGDTVEITNLNSGLCLTIAGVLNGTSYPSSTPATAIRHAAGATPSLTR